MARFERALERLAGRLATPQGDLAGREIGPYRLIESIGSGGMGDVYRAERVDGSFEQVVAIKLVRARGVRDDVVRRFEHERQLLARLEHPHIARLFDGGPSEEGPYFVMELVQGPPITEYCDSRRLSVGERLALFDEVLGALDYAHRNLVVHRDLKPSNILVGADGMVKLLDFGIAKVLDSDSGAALTRTAQPVLTPAYSSPEQIRGEGVTTATDVFALGLLLFELLSGRRPFEGEGSTPLEQQRALLEVETPRLASVVRETDEVAERRGVTPGQLRKLLHGDLEAIVERALRKDPADRYPSVQALRDDLERFRRGEPVLARRGSTWYRWAKFLRRHRTAAAITGLLVVALTVAAGGLLAGRIAAERERAEAERQAAIAEAINRFVLEDLLDRANLNRGGDREVTVLEAVRGAATRLEERFADQPEVEASVRTTLASALRALGHFEEAEPHLARALDLFRESLGPEAAWTLAAQGDLAGVYVDMARYGEAADLLAEALEVRRRVFGSEEDGTLTLMNNLAFLYDELGRYEDSAPLHEEVLATRRLIDGPEHLNTLISMNNLAWVRLRVGRVDEAAELWKEKLRLARKTLGEEHPETLGARMWLAQVALRRERYGAVVEDLAPAYEIARRELGASHPLTVSMLQTLGQAEHRLGDLDAAEASLREALDRRREALGPDHPEVQRLAREVAQVLAARGHVDEADSLLRDAIVAVRRHHPELEELLGGLLEVRGRVLMEAGRAQEAEVTLAEGCELLVGALGGEHALSGACAARLAELYEDLGRSAEAERWRGLAAEGQDPAIEK